MTAGITVTLGDMVGVLPMVRPLGAAMVAVLALVPIQAKALVVGLARPGPCRFPSATGRETWSRGCPTGGGS